MHKRLLILYVFIFQFIIGFSQQYTFRNYSIKEGLSQSTVYDILSTRDGYLWIATGGGGISIFDSQKFLVINKSKGLRSDYVRSLAQDVQGNIWVGTDKGIDIVNVNRKIAHVSNGELQNKNIICLFVDDAGFVWAGTDESGLFCLQYRNDTLLVVKHFTSANGLFSNFVAGIAPVNSQILYISMVGGVCKLNVATGKIERIISQDVTLHEDLFWAIESDSKGRLWVSTQSHGIQIINPNNDKIVPHTLLILSGVFAWDIQRVGEKMIVSTNSDGIFIIDQNDSVEQITTNNGLVAEKVFKSTTDREGNLWFASDNKGILLYRGHTILGFGKKEGLSSTNITAVALASKSDTKTWFASNNELYRIDESSMLCSIQRLRFDLHESISALAKNRHDELWIGTKQGSIFVLKNDKLIDVTRSFDLPTGLSINALFIDSKENVWASTSAGFNVFNGLTSWGMKTDDGLIHNEVQSIVEDNYNQLWMATLGGVVRIKAKEYRDFNEVDGLSDTRVNCITISPKGNSVWVGTMGGGVFYSKVFQKDSIHFFALHIDLPSKNIMSMAWLDEQSLLVGTDKGFSHIGLSKSLDSVLYCRNFNQYDGYSGIESNLNALCCNGNKALFGTIDGLYLYQADSEKSVKQTIVCLEDVRLFFEKTDWSKYSSDLNNYLFPKQLQLSYDKNHLTFHYTAISYANADKVQYSYQLDGFDHNWSPPQSNGVVTFSKLPPGEYIMKMRVRDGGEWSKPTEYAFEILPPFYKTWWFISIVIAISLLLIFVFVKLRENQLIKEKLILERLVVERTAEIEQQKEELQAQTEQLMMQGEILEERNSVLATQKKEITDSIHYAEKIQTAVLPPLAMIKQIVDCEILYHPKDIVSGDFYWATQLGDLLLFSVADCTGHGVPGAFMSMLGVSFLNKIVNEQRITDPGLIINALRQNIMLALKQKQGFESRKDGMDMALCTYQASTRTLQFAGANNPAILISNNVVTELKADKMPVAIYEIMSDFTSKTIQVAKGDRIFLFSDGFVDQFGGDKGKKFKSKPFYELLLETNSLPLSQQIEYLRQTILSWMHPSADIHYEQIDDICVMGVEF